ncbi:Metallopeptidase, catalytic domain protein [Niveomyces insectorum RCEF 264]|uniref:Metallopeptidase, catalytic domain protein n=1 Tax=Niveomyces insectorum RCEF 264 TaxID=1081102 RepID=A0A167W674_9HYPO|nr:Metallopeptidase, catalytic domain protein [Niveomyces insectorum RCEF 264]
MLFSRRYGLSTLAAGFALGQVSLVLAGSRAWEAPLRHLMPLERHQYQVDAAGHAIVDNATAEEHLAKRYLSIQPSEGTSGFKIWPQSTISYCFETQDARDKLLEHLELAIEAWRSDGAGGPGLHRDVYKYMEVFDPGDSCVNNNQRDRVLVISYNADGRLSTTVGMPSLDADNPDYKGPSMMLSDAPGIGMLDTVANYAHEIGHAWGLYHEHQNINFWGPPYNTGAMSSVVFGDRFDCTVLKDYPDALSRAQRGGGQNDVDLLCKLRGVAAKYKFSAVDWLPIMGGTRMHAGASGTGPSTPDYTKVDWDSIMMYPSGAGATGDAVPPGGDSDRRANVLLRNDGARMKINLVPSALDIQGVKQLYEGDLQKKSGEFAGLPVLPNSKSSKWSKRFKDTFKKKKGC